MVPFFEPDIAELSGIRVTEKFYVLVLDGFPPVAWQVVRVVALVGICAAVSYDLCYFLFATGYAVRACLL